MKIGGFSLSYYILSFANQLSFDKIFLLWTQTQEILPHAGPFFMFFFVTSSKGKRKEKNKIPLAKESTKEIRQTKINQESKKTLDTPISDYSSISDDSWMTVPFLLRQRLLHF